METEQDNRTAESLIKWLEENRDARCATCDKTVSAHEGLLAIAMGFKNSPRCLLCLSATLDSKPDILLNSVVSYIQNRDCYREAWNWANGQAGCDQNAVPSFLSEAPGEAKHARAVPAIAPQPVNVNPADFWDAGDMGCGDLVLELRMRMRSLAPGDLFELCARDPGAPEDLPAWCRLTGHLLLRADHPTYLIQRKK